MATARESFCQTELEIEHAYHNDACIDQSMARMDDLANGTNVG